MITSHQCLLNVSLFLSGIAFCAPTIQAQESPQNTMFPFVMPWNDASATITDVSVLNPAPLDQTRLVSVQGGHFTDSTGRRVRFIVSEHQSDVIYPETINRSLNRVRCCWPVAGDVENTGMIWNAERTSVSGNWGHGPTVADGIPAQTTLLTTARGAEIYALDGSGTRLGKVPSQLQNGSLKWSVGPQ